MSNYARLFFKAIVDKLRVDLLLASLAIAILLFKIIAFDAWWMVFVFCVSYLALVGIEFLIRRLKRNRETQRKIQGQLIQERQKEEDFNEEVWKRFYALDKQSLECVTRVYLADKDPCNPYVRFIRDGGLMAYSIERNEAFRIPKGGSYYYLLLRAEHIGNTSVISFQPYYFDLVAHYVETGKMERLMK